MEINFNKYRFKYLLYGFLIVCLLIGLVKRSFGAVSCVNDPGGSGEMCNKGKVNCPNMYSTFYPGGAGGLVSCGAGGHDCCPAGAGGMFMYTPSSGTDPGSDTWSPSHVCLWTQDEFYMIWHGTSDNMFTSDCPSCGSGGVTFGKLYLSNIRDTRHVVPVTRRICWGNPSCPNPYEEYYWFLTYTTEVLSDNCFYAGCSGGTAACYAGGGPSNPICKCASGTCPDKYSLVAALSGTTCQCGCWSSGGGELGLNTPGFGEKNQSRMERGGGGFEKQY